MSVIRIRDPNALSPSHVVLIVLVGVMIAGSALLLSAAESLTAIDGAIPWRQGDVLQEVVKVLCLNYSLPTLYAGEIKSLVLAAGAGLAAMVLGIALCVGSRLGDEESAEDVQESEVSDAGVARLARAQLEPLATAQVLMVIYLLWSLASSSWSAAPALAVGGTIILTIQCLWSLSLGNGLSPAAGKAASRIVIVVTGITGVLAIWYYYGRNPVLRAKFPYGNPLFLSTCLIPGILLAGAYALEVLRRPLSSLSPQKLMLGAASILVVALSLWAFYLTRSRGPAAGLFVGVLAMFFFAIRGRLRWIPVGVAGLLFIAVAGQLLAKSNDLSAAGATQRFRTYGWTYALDMVTERSFRGHGQAGFVLAGDSFVANDAINDPLAFPARMTHAHNEWLEVLVDLGPIGLLLIGSVLVLTLMAGSQALASSPSPGQGWALIALMGGLVGLIVEECGSVGLRVTGVPAVFYTLIGLIWAIAGSNRPAPLTRLLSTQGRRIMGGATFLIAGGGAVVFGQMDFAAARGAFQFQEQILSGRFEDAIETARRATKTRNPQRALANLYRLSQAHLNMASELQQLANDRRARASQVEPPDDQALLRAASEDYWASSEHCRQGLEVLNQLVTKAPGYFNHGLLEYWLSRIQGGNVELLGKPEAQLLFEENARDAILRELARQPFDETITLQYLIIADSLGDFSDEEGFLLDDYLTILARPLRHGSIGEGYASLLGTLSTNKGGFENALHSIAELAKQRIANPPDPTTQEEETFAPEKLRLAATVHFQNGRYDQAVELLELAAKAYDEMAHIAPLGAASCYGELGDSEFWRTPADPARALKYARKAVDLAPDSFPGRNLIAAVKDRMITYHLAAGDETAARKILKEERPAGTNDLLLDSQLGGYYAAMSYELLQKRAGSVNLRAVPLEVIGTWADRALALSPGHPLAHYVAADQAFEKKDCVQAATHVRTALENGLPVQPAWRFVGVAVGKGGEGADCSEMNKLWDELKPLVPPAAPPPTAPKRGLPALRKGG